MSFPLGQNKNPVPTNAGTGIEISCGATLLSAMHSLNAYYHTLTLFTKCLLRLAYS